MARLRSALIPVADRARADHQPDQRDVELQKVHDVYRLSGTEARARLANALHRLSVPQSDEPDALRITLLDLERILTGDESIGAIQSEDR